MRRTLPTLLASLLAASALPGCITPPEPADLAVAGYPSAFLAHALAGDDLRVVELGAQGALHDFEPSARDLDQLRRSTHLVLWDASLEAWAHRAEDSLGTSAPRVYEAGRLPDGEAYILRDADDHDAGHDADADGDADGADDHGHDHGDEPHDPHTWTDPLAVRASAQALGAHLQREYPEHADAIQNRTAALVARLDALHAEFQAGLTDCANDLVVTNHEAHAYLARRYGFDLVALHGLEPGSEPSPATVQRVIDLIKEHDLPVVFIEEGTDADALRAIQDETGVAVRVLHTLETRPAHGDHLDAQRENLDALRAALECP